MIKAVVFDMYETLITLFESPLYFERQMAVDADVDENSFQAIWSRTQTDRTKGNVTLEDVLKKILQLNNCYSEKKVNLIVKKSIHCKEEAFEHLHTEIIPMLRLLKENGILIGLISNCFSEEAMVIKKSVLFPYFDVVCLSFDEGMQKPDLVIFERCLEKLNVKANECLYAGDGGSNELESAQKLGMQAVQACWYLKEGTSQPSKRKAEFKQVETPLDILKIVKSGR